MTMFSFWDFLNLIISLSITGLVAKHMKFSDKIILILVFHVVLIFFLDLVMSPTYFGDQMRYYLVAMDYRHGDYNLEAGNVANAGKMMAFFPLFIDSYKSIAFGNYLIYLSMFVFMLKKTQTPEMQRMVKIIFLLFPAMTLYSSLGLRDYIILFTMFFSLYYLFFKKNILVIFILLYLLFIIKGQNALLYIFVVMLYFFESVRFKFVRYMLYGIFLAILYVAFSRYQGDLLFYRQAMFVEDMRIYDTLAPAWTPLDLYRFYLAPFFYDARNAMQLLQSMENVFAIWLVVRVSRLRKNISDIRGKKVIDNFFLLAGIMYSYVVFNYGTITRYKFPFLICWLLISILMIDKDFSLKAKTSITKDVEQDIVVAK